MLRAILASARWSCRIEVVDPGGQLETLRREKHAVVLSFWHNRSFLAAFTRELWTRGVDILVLASKSRDGELVARLAKLLKLSVVRGSASRGGRDAMRAIYRAVRDEGSSPVVIPDGPRGPLYEFKVGAAILAQISQAPVLPMGMAASRFFNLKSWDRLIVPWPFSKIVVVVGDPHSVERRISSEELERERLELQNYMVELTRQAEERLGVKDVARGLLPAATHL